MTDKLLPPYKPPLDARDRPTGTLEGTTPFNKLPPITGDMAISEPQDTVIRRRPAAPKVK